MIVMYGKSIQGGARMSRPPWHGGSRSRSRRSRRVRPQGLSDDSAAPRLGCATRAQCLSGARWAATGLVRAELLTAAQPAVYYFK